MKFNIKDSISTSDDISISKHSFQSGDLIIKTLIQSSYKVGQKNVQYNFTFQLTNKINQNGKIKIIMPSSLSIVQTPIYQVLFHYS